MYMYIFRQYFSSIISHGATECDHMITCSAVILLQLIHVHVCIVLNVLYFYCYRSLTPNPKLNEIVAAVRNLQGAVQEDTGIPTG